MIKRGDVYYADLDPVIGSEQKGHRPIIVIQNDIGNLYSPTTIAAMVTSSQKKKLPNISFAINTVYHLTVLIRSKYS